MNKFKCDGNHSWVCDSNTVYTSYPPKYQWYCVKCGKVIYRDCSAGPPPISGCHNECRHDDSTLSTLETIYISPFVKGEKVTDSEFWITRCKICEKYTHATVTQKESFKLACLDMWCEDKGNVTYCPNCGKEIESK